MKKKENVLIEAWPSPMVFAATLTVIYIIACLITIGLKGMITALAGNSLVSLPFFLLFATVYGVMVGLVAGAFQRRALSIPVGIVAGPVGGWFNWGFLVSLVIWATIYCVWLCVKATFTWHWPLWTLLGDTSVLGKAYAYEGATALIWVTGMALGILSLFLYTRLKYTGDMPVLNKKTAYVVLIIMAATGLVAAISAPVASVDDIFATTKSRADAEEIKGVNASYGYVIPGQGEWTVAIDNSAVSVKKGLINPDVTLTLSAETMERVALKTLVLERDLDRFRAEGNLKLVTEKNIGTFFKPYEAPTKKDEKKEDEGAGGMMDLFAKDKELEQIFTSMPERAIAEKISGVNGRYGFNIKVMSGGEWTVVIDNGKVEVLEGLDNPGVTVFMTKEDFVLFSQGRIDLAKRIERFHVEGDRSLFTDNDSSRFFTKYQPSVGLVFMIMMTFLAFR